MYEVFKGRKTWHLLRCDGRQRCVFIELQKVKRKGLVKCLTADRLFLHWTARRKGRGHTCFGTPLLVSQFSRTLIASVQALFCLFISARYVAISQTDFGGRLPPFALWRQSWLFLTRNRRGGNLWVGRWEQSPLTGLSIHGRPRLFFLAQNRRHCKIAVRNGTMTVLPSILGNAFISGEDTRVLTHHSACTSAFQKERNVFLKIAVVEVSFCRTVI